MTPLLVGFAVAFGLAVGSFLNVVAHRVPLGLSVVRPASACPRCAMEIQGRDNVPVLSWLLLRGRCRGCSEPISVRYPLVEALTAVAFGLVALAVGTTVDARGGWTAADGVELVAYLYLAAISVALAAIDLDTRRLPDRIVLPSYAVAVVLLGAVDLLRGDPAAAGLAAAGAGASVLLYLLLAVAKPGGMGLGDVKLAGVLGLFLGHLGLPALVVGTAGAFVAGGVFGVLLIVLGRAGRTSGIPFGPWMLVGAWAGIAAGEPIARWYLGVTGLA